MVHPGDHRQPDVRGPGGLLQYPAGRAGGFLRGVIVDRLRYRTTSIAADVASAAAVAVIPLLHAASGIELWQLLTLVFVGALLDAPGSTARVALLPEVVERAGVRVERANGIRSAIQQASWFVGAPIGGARVAGFGATTALWLNAASFLVSAALVAAVVPAARRKAIEEHPSGYLAELKEGLRFIWSERVVRGLVVTVLITNFLDAPLPVALPVFAREAFGNATVLGLMYGVSGGAALVGSLVYGAIGHRLSRRLTFVSCFTIVPISYLTLATLPTLPVALIALAISGLAGGPLNPVINTVAFDLVPADMRGRAFGALRAGTWASIPLGVLIGGAVIEAVGVGVTFLAIGMCYVAVTLYGFFNRAFKDMDGVVAGTSHEERPAPADGR